MINMKTFSLGASESADCVKKGKRYYCAFLDVEGHLKQDINEGPFDSVNFPQPTSKNGKCNGVELLSGTDRGIAVTFNAPVECTVVYNKVSTRKWNNTLLCKKPE